MFLTPTLCMFLTLPQKLFCMLCSNIFQCNDISTCAGPKFCPGVYYPRYRSLEGPSSSPSSSPSSPSLPSPSSPSSPSLPSSSSSLSPSLCKKGHQLEKSTPPPVLMYFFIYLFTTKVRVISHKSELCSHYKT